MRAVNPAAQALRAERGGLAERWMVWIAARHRDTPWPRGARALVRRGRETITVTDLWTGASATRVFQGAGSLLGVVGLQHQAGLTVRPVRLVALGDRRDGDRRGPALRRPRRPAADLEAHALDRDRAPGRPARAVFKGFVNRAPIPRPAAGGSASLELEVVSAVRLLTIPAGRKKSDAAQQLRDGRPLPPLQVGRPHHRRAVGREGRPRQRLISPALSRPLERPSCHAASPGLARPPRRAHRGASDPALRLRRRTTAPPSRRARSRL